MTKLDTKVRKFLKTKLTSVDVAKREVTFCFSDDQEDRMGEIVDQATWDTKNYDENPLILWGHDPSISENVLGSAVSLDLNKDGKSYVTARFDDAETNENADRVFRQVVNGTLRCTSAGFIPHNKEYRDDVPVLKDNELLEISIVPIPANPRAIALAYKAGSISKKDADWLTKSMEAEAAFIRKQMEVEAPTEKEKSMSTEDNKAMGAMMDAITKLAENQAKSDERLEAAVEKMTQAISQKGAVADILNADSSWEASEEKWMLQQPVAEVYWAFCEAFFYTATPASDFKTLLAETVELLQSIIDGTYGDQEGVVAKAAKTVDASRAKELMTAMFASKAAETPAPEATPAPQDEEKPAPTEDQTKTDTDDEARDQAPADAGKKPEDKPADTDDETNDEDDDQDDLAKGGDNDQPGATDGEIDDDTELTPEQEEELRAETRAQYEAAKS